MWKASGGVVELLRGKSLFILLTWVTLYSNWKVFHIITHMVIGNSHHYHLYSGTHSIASVCQLAMYPADTDKWWRKVSDYIIQKAMPHSVEACVDQKTHPESSAFHWCSTVVRSLTHIPGIIVFTNQYLLKDISKPQKCHWHQFRIFSISWDGQSREELKLILKRSYFITGKAESRKPEQKNKVK